MEMTYTIISILLYIYTDYEKKPHHFCTHMYIENSYFYY